MRVVITGSSLGIGKAVAGKLIENGHEVWGLARRRQVRLRPQRADATCGHFRSSVCDVSNWASVRKAVLAINKEWGAIDALITCAARQGVIGPAVTLDPGEWSKTVRVILDGTLNSIAGFFPLLRNSSQRVKVICFSGGGATSPRPNFSAYAAAKAGVVRLVETLAEEWRDFQIDINAVAPGALPTQMTAEVLALGPEGAGAREYAMAKKTMSTGSEAFEKICALIDFLLSPQSDGISGRLISATWDSWQNLESRKADLAGSDVFTLRRITPGDRGMTF